MTEFKERWERMSTIEKIAHLRADWDSCRRSDPMVAMVAAAVAHSVLREAGEEITRLRAERDDARREVCCLRANPPDKLRLQTRVFHRAGNGLHFPDFRDALPEDFADLLGWDCFKEAGK